MEVPEIVIRFFLSGFEQEFHLLDKTLCLIIRETCGVGTQGSYILFSQLKFHLQK